MKRTRPIIISLLLLVSLFLSGCFTPAPEPTINLDDIPAYSGEAWIYINDGVPTFTEEDYTTESYEFYSELDSLGRCGYAMACIGIDIMPTEERGSIGSVKPSGWHSVIYDIVDGGYLYNRCHLIGFQLTGENANRKNLITGTKYLNIEGMLEFENLIADKVKENNVHVLYRVTPIYEGTNLVASGVHMEAYSVEDNGELVSFNVYAYNVQPGITINYATGTSYLSGTSGSTDTGKDEPITGEEESDETYILNTSSKKFHKPTCSGVSSMKEENKEEYTGTKGELITDGYTACGTCKP